MAFETPGSSSLPGGWSWPDDLPPESNIKPSSEQTHNNHTNPKQDKPISSSTSTGSSFFAGFRSSEQQQQRQQRREPQTSAQKESTSNTQGEAPRPRKQKHWRPRTCRICLDTVYPTFHPQTDNLPGVLQGPPKVTYDSEAGRLISPCKCKGSSRYVHESCLQEWRHADPSYGKRNYWNCPTCGFRYRLERMQWGRWISSKATQIGLTLLIFMGAVFALGFVADPIINLYMDPYDTITSIPSGKSFPLDDFQFAHKYEASWVDHFIKGLASLGLLGFVKIFFTLSPWQWFNLRSSGIMSSGRRGNSGRNRVNNLNWLLIVVGVCTFVYSKTVWKAVRAWSCRVLEKASERVMDVQVDDNDYDEEDDT